nr:hypothetical protein [Tanacetum cinerariifolium]
MDGSGCSEDESGVVVAWSNGGDDGDEGGGYGVRGVVVVLAVTVVGTKGRVAASGGEWGMGSSRSDWGEHFWVCRKRSPEKFSGGDGWWPAVVVFVCVLI